VGDKVLLYSETKTVMLWAMLVFVLPVIACFATVITVSFYTSSPLLLTLTALITFFGIFTVLRLIFRNKKDSDIFIIKEITCRANNIE
jgi:positive regulator of sigma E activity